MSIKIYQLNASAEYTSSVCGYFQTQEDAERMKKLIEVHSRLFNKLITLQDNKQFSEFLKIVKEIEASLNGANFPLAAENETLSIKEIELSSPIESKQFDINLQRLEDFEKKFFKT